MSVRSFIIPATNQNLVIQKLDKLNKRAVKLGLDPVVLSWGKAIVNDQGGVLLPCELLGSLSISYDGWEFIATLQHLPTGENIIRSITNEYEIPFEYRTSGSACEHCNVKRYRKDTYVVRHDATEEAKQVGSSCIKDFLGGNSPDNIMQRASFIGELLSFMEGSERETSHSVSEGIFYIVNFLAQTAAVIREHGWFSKAKASETGGKSTASRVEDNYKPPFSGFQFSNVLPEDKVLAQEAADWAENLSDEEVESSDYLYNIRAIARSGMVGWRTVGFAASIISAYLKTKPEPAVQESNFVGALKQRTIFDLFVKKVSGFSSMYGYTNKYLFQDLNGNILVWLTSTNQDLQEGKRYSIKGTIKSHKEFKGVRETEINRCEVMTHYE